MTDQVKRLQIFKKIKFELDLFRLLKSCGVKRSLVEEIPTELANRKPEKGVDYYYYIGPLDEKTRPFCRLMLSIDKVFTKEEIEYMSEELEYPVLEYKGSYNCRHNWVKFRGQIINTPKPTQREIRRLINSNLPDYKG